MTIPAVPVTQSFCDDTVEIASDSITTPASLVVKSYLGVSGAPYAVVNSPLPPVGTVICLQINIVGQPQALEGGIDIRHTVEADDTPVSVATTMVDWFNTGMDESLSQPLGIYAEQTPGEPNIAFINTAANLVQLTDVTAATSGGAVQSAFTIYPNSQPAWDAGPMIGLRKVPGGFPAV